MSRAECGCAGRLRQLTEQVSVMRREIKNLRKHMDGSVRAHKKQMSSLQSSLTDRVKPVKSDSSSQNPNLHNQLLEGRIHTVPIGYIRSCFAVKTGTPRQANICSTSRATLKIQPSVFNNPEHCLAGLEQYSHIWLVFIFHKNGQMSSKAKVKPPRLNGQKMGVFATRSPHRPNALGLSLAKLDGITGDTLHLSGVDVITGTPVLDIKPYIPHYDSPKTPSELLQKDQTHTAPQMEFDEDEDPVQTEASIQESRISCPVSSCEIPRSRDLTDVLAEVKDYLTAPQIISEHDEQKNVAATTSSSHLSFGQEDLGRIAAWVKSPPVSELDVRFTLNAEMELKDCVSTNCLDSTKPLCEFLKSPEEAMAAIRGILSADPRSVYRRTRCSDRLFFFTLDCLDVSCWFGDGFAEVVRVRLVQSLDPPAKLLTFSSVVDS